MTLLIMIVLVFYLMQRCRIERQAFGLKYTMNIFQSCGYIYVARSTLPRCSDLQELIRLCRGKVTTVVSRAKIAIGEYHDSSEVTCVKEAWILDCITFNKLMPFKEYLIDSQDKLSCRARKDCCHFKTTDCCLNQSLICFSKKYTVFDILLIYRVYKELEFIISVPVYCFKCI